MGKSKSSIIIPPPLDEGDKIAILSPSGIVKPDKVYRAIPYLKDQGWDPYVTDHAFDRDGTYAGTVKNRLHDLKKALRDRDTRAIMCSRGGYGAVHLLEELSKLDLRHDPKWVIGFSDITVLHCLMASQGIASIHSHMTGHLASSGEDDDSTSLFDILSGHMMVYECEPHSLNRKGKARAPLMGGNLSCIADLISTPYDVIRPGTILFMEDVSEPAYKIERIMYQIRLSGVMSKLKGMIVGRFSKCSSDIEGETVEDIIKRVIEPYDFPVAFNCPIGHVSHNLPMVVGADVTLHVTDDLVTIDQRQ